ncbi:MAG: DUF1116 domain-containing protein [Aquisalimonadaceae bacterium]
MNTTGSGFRADEASTLRAATRMADVRPIWHATGRADALLGLGRRQLLHAGPPVRTPSALTQPLLNAACAALLFEGEAADPAEARRLIVSGEVRLRPAQDLDVVTPLAAVVSPSMWLHAVADVEDASLVAYSPLNEGAGPAQRFGCLNAEVVERLAFVHRVIGPAIAAAKFAAVDLLELALQGLNRGDELHARVGVGSMLLAERLRGHGYSSEVTDFLAGNTHGFLNPWMAACRCMMAAAGRRQEGQLLIAAGGNGMDFGIQLASAPGQWLSAPAEVPEGPPMSPELASRPRLAAIGDSAVIDAVGFGALALDAAPEHAAILDPALVEAMNRVSETLLSVTHPVLNRPVGVNAARVTASTLPGVCLAALDAQGERGLIGLGLARHPSALYANAG